MPERERPARHPHLYCENRMTPIPIIRAAVAFVGIAILCACNSSSDSSTLVVETFRNPPEVRSANGELRIVLNVATGPVQIAGQTVTTTVYNGMYIPPLLRLRPGDTLFLDIDNRSSEPTNWTPHGLNVSPRINSDGTVGDNVFVSIDPANRLSYRIAIPGTHNPGLYWYHTHLHILAQRQVMGGLSGGLIIDGILDPLPQLQGLIERVMLLKDIQVTPQGTVPDDVARARRAFEWSTGRSIRRSRFGRAKHSFSASPTLAPMCITGCFWMGMCSIRSHATATAPRRSRLVKRYCSLRRHALRC